MATMTAKAQWTDYAMLEPTTPTLNKKGEPVQWKVQINQDGGFRCSCPSFIFSKVQPRSCKHTRACVRDRQTSGVSPAVQTYPHQWVGTITGTVTPKAPVTPYINEARVMVAAMLSDAQISATEVQKRKLSDTLAAKLAQFKPVVQTAAVAVAAVSAGLRRITFSDDD